ncbi:hypothetical protein BGX29_011344 [Mortierella sp. GBA35]|nr:hypothetical protein BGX29_011344 [Mortierella sp. GBA35]
MIAFSGNTPTPRPEVILPPEIWLHGILQYLYPSQLAALSGTSRTMHELVIQSRIWKHIFEKSTLSFLEPVPSAFAWTATLSLEDRSDPSISQQEYEEIDRYKNWRTKVYLMQACCAFSYRICEQCFRLDKDFHGGPAFMPCLVQESHLSPPKRSAITGLNAPVPTTRSVPESAPEPVPESRLSLTWNHCIRMCLDCRRQLYIKHPEPIPASLTERGLVFIRKADAYLKYGINGCQLNDCIYRKQHYFKTLLPTPDTPIDQYPPAPFYGDNPDVYVRFIESGTAYYYLSDDNNKQERGTMIPELCVLVAAREIYGGDAGVAVRDTFDHIVNTLRRELQFRNPSESNNEAPKCIEI